jgi:flavin reductase (DIM6/NTAB) family NADH-FMN oxidoreductase RutF
LGIAGISFFEGLFGVINSNQSKHMPVKKISANDIRSMDKVPRLKLINSISGFKSANFIGTTAKNSNENLAIFNSVVHVGSNPPLLGFITRPETVPRHTYQNIKETGCYTINHIHSGIYEKAHQTSGKYREDLSEFDQVGLTPHYSENLAAPYVNEAHIQMGMKLVEEHFIEANGTVFLIGAIEGILLHDDYRTEDGALDLEQAETVAISGISSYHSTQRLDKLEYVRVPDRLSREK